MVFSFSLEQYVLDKDIAIRRVYARNGNTFFPVL